MFLYISFYHVILVLSGTKSKKKSKTKKSTSQSKLENTEGAASYTTDNLTTTVNEIPKFDVKQGIAKYNHI